MHYSIIILRIRVCTASAGKADDNLRKQLQNLDPANHVNKGSDPDPDKLVARVESLIGYLMEKYKQKK